MASGQYLYLTTTGRQTGLPREIEIWFTNLNGRYYIIAENRERAGWVQNILHQPRISLRVGNQNFTGVGRIVDQANERELWENVRELSDRKYGWSDGLIVELTPAPDIYSGFQLRVSWGRFPTCPSRPYAAGWKPAPPLAGPTQLKTAVSKSGEV